MSSHGYPRPQLRRGEWTSLNGDWQFAIDPSGQWTNPTQVVWADTIRVPYAPETRASRIDQTGFFNACWYRRRIEPPRVRPGARAILHFGAVDYAATVWVNGQLVAQHEGGYTPFSTDITAHLGSAGADLVVRAFDDPHDLAKPRGKQDWCLQPHSIWYPRTSGIWQTVWLETVGGTAIGGIRWRPNLERWELGLMTWLDGAETDDFRLHVRLGLNGKALADDTYLMIGGTADRRIALPDPGAEDGRLALLWSPERPSLIKAEISLLAPDGTAVDRVESYTAMRSIAVEENRVLLNGRPYPLRFVLDQGYWPETGLTPPDDEALCRDIRLAKMMGFNGVRKHQKIEDPRYLYWADRLGLLVWGEMPTAHQFTQAAIQRFTSEWMDVIARDFNHPCLIAWVPFNESWGTPNLAGVEEQRHYARSIYHLTKALDPTRPVIGNDGWESVETDIVGIHDYCQDPVQLYNRYHAAEVMGPILGRRLSGRLVSLSAKELGSKPVMLTEFGGMALSADPLAWGYSRCGDAEGFRQSLQALVGAVNDAQALSGYCYTQLTDTYQETNGLLWPDRTPKLPLESIRRAIIGQGDARAAVDASKRRAGTRAR